MTEETNMILEKLEEMKDVVAEIAVGDRTIALETKDIVMEMEEIILRIEKIALGTQITLENDISRKLNAIIEGNDILKGRLNEELEMKEKGKSWFRN